LDQIKSSCVLADPQRGKVHQISLNRQPDSLYAVNLFY
jgi:hypothetical protein